MNDGDYLIIVPRVFRAGTTQNIGINIFGNKSCDVRLTLDDSTKRGISSQARGHFRPNEAGMLELQVSFYQVIVSGHCDTSSANRNCTKSVASRIRFC